jgi:hypothetical protein
MFHLSLCLCMSQFQTFLLIVLGENRHVEFTRRKLTRTDLNWETDRNFDNVPWPLYVSELSVFSIPHPQ